MTITAMGCVVIPTSFLIFVFRPEWLVPWAILMAAFQAASVINIGGGFPIGIGPYFFVTVLLAARFLPLWLSGQINFTRGDLALRVLRPLLLLMLWGVVSAFVLPSLFAGIGVDTPRAGMDRMYTAALQWSMSNAAQAGYLVLNCIFLVYIVWQTRRYDQIEAIVKAFIWSGVIVSIIGAYQLTTRFTGLPFPDNFFNSNPAWRQLFAQTVFGSGAWRLSATFNEPSGAGAFFAVWTAFLLFLATDKRTTSLVFWLLLASGLVMLFLTTSTTGYATGSILVGLFAWRELARLFLNGAIRVQTLLSLAVIASALIVAAALLPDFRNLLDKIVFQKADTVSAQARSATMWEAVQIATETCGLGVGLGSNRPSGMFFYIISNLGLPGAFLFGYLICATRSIVRQAKREPGVLSVVAGYLTAAGWAFGIELVAMGISGADISSPYLWISWGLVGAIARYNWTVSGRLFELKEPVAQRIEARTEPAEVVLLQPDYRIT